jgi:hypothetical protein
MGGGSVSIRRRWRGLGWPKAGFTVWDWRKWGSACDALSQGLAPALRDADGVGVRGEPRWHPASRGKAAVGFDAYQPNAKFVREASVTAQRLMGDIARPYLMKRALPSTKA